MCGSYKIALRKVLQSAADGYILLLPVRVRDIENVRIMVAYTSIYSPASNHSVNSSSHSVNGDIAIQWEWSNFDPSQNPNPLTDYDKTLHH